MEEIYLNLFSGFIKKTLNLIKVIYKEVPQIFRDLKHKGILQSFYAWKFRRNRRTAFVDLERMLPLIEERILPYLKKYINKTTNLSESPIERNVFVFWWDGFANAPEIVQQCLNSVKMYHSDCRIIEITKDTYTQYTDINPIILRDYYKGKISVQTFSDILRFNLLKNNGGIWIDSTIFFTREYNLLEGLRNKSFESVCFPTSSKFLKYKDMECSWSGYFIASRKNSVLVQAVNEVFEKYYLEYGTYSLYFFIDATLMVCKLNHIDDDVLSKVHYNSNDMFFLLNNLNRSYDETMMGKIDSIPQKLNWAFKYRTKEEDTFYTKLIQRKKGDLDEENIN